MLRWLSSSLSNTLVGKLLFPSAHGASSKAPRREEPIVPNAGVGLEPRAPGVGEKPGELVSKLAGTEGFKAIKIVGQATTISPTRATFRLGGPDGIKLLPGQEVLLEIPAELRARAVYQAVIEHRQVQSAKSSVPVSEAGSKPWDETPGVTALHFHVTSPGIEGWRYWCAPWGSSGSDGGKYAEIRPDWETESHFDFAKNGTAPVGGKKAAKAPITVDALRLRGVGDDPTFIREVTITFAPPKPTLTEELVFTPGTQIGDLITAQGQKHGKIKDAGTYPGALALLDGGDGGEGISKLKEGWSFEGGQLYVPMVAGKRFTGVEISCGDTKPDGKLNTDGEIGTQGHSRLRMGLLRAGAKEPEWFVDDHGVPPQGVLFGGPKHDHKVAAGDQLVLGASVDPTYLMALRINYND